MSANTIRASDGLLLIEDDSTRVIEGMLKAAGSSFAITHLTSLAEGKTFRGDRATDQRWQT
jgi:hypothetical protein